MVSTGGFDVILNRREPSARRHWPGASKELEALRFRVRPPRLQNSPRMTLDFVAGLNQRCAEIAAATGSQTQCPPWRGRLLPAEFRVLRTSFRHEN